MWSLWSELSWLQTLSHVFVLEPFLKVLEEAVFFLHIKNRWLPLSSSEHRDLCWCLDWGWLLEFLSVSLFSSLFLFEFGTVRSYTFLNMVSILQLYSLTNWVSLTQDKVVNPLQLEVYYNWFKEQKIFSSFEVSCLNRHSLFSKRNDELIMIDRKARKISFNACFGG